MKYATRVNSFLRDKISVLEAVKRIASVEGVDYVDLNYPEHFKEFTPAQVKAEMDKYGLKLNAINMRFRDIYLNGEFGNANAEISRKAVSLCKEAAKVCKEMNGAQIIVWLGFDGFDYSFQMDYVKAWNQAVACFKEICDDTDLPISIEYKPYEERVHAMIDSFGTTMYMLQAVNKKNLGVTLDFCHMLMKSENPAFAAALLLEKGLLYNVHLNDGEGRTDDGLMVGSVNLWKSLEFMYYLKKYDFQGAIYFDTFPKREPAVEECASNIAMCRKLEEMVDRIGLAEMERVISANSAIEVQKMYMKLL